MVTAEEYKRAEFDLAVAEAKRGWKIHAAVYAVVIAGLIVLNALLVTFTDANFPWAVFPLVGWGIGLGFHYVYGVRKATVEIARRQRSIEARAERMPDAA